MRGELRTWAVSVLIVLLSAEGSTHITIAAISLQSRKELMEGLVRSVDPVVIGVCFISYLGILGGLAAAQRRIRRTGVWE